MLDQISFFYLSFAVANFFQYSIFIRVQHYLRTQGILLVKNLRIYCKLLHMLRLKKGNNAYSNCNADTVEMDISSRFFTIFHTCSFTFWISFCPKNFCPMNFLKHLQIENTISSICCYVINILIMLYCSILQTFCCCSGYQLIKLTRTTKECLTSQVKLVLVSSLISLSNIFLHLFSIYIC